MSTHARARVGSGVVLAVLIAACSTTMTGRRQLTLIDDEKMDALGVAAFTDIKQQGKVEKDRRPNTYVRCVADPILAVIPKGGAAPKDGRWEVIVFDDSTPNAFALPGGKIGVHTGMLAVATTQGQLAAVIGHEIGHVLLRHGNERMSQSIVAQSAMDAGSVALSQTRPEYRDAVVGGLGVGAQYGVLLPFSRKHESEADVVGQRFMAQAGFNPAEAIALWKKMAKLSQGTQPPEWMSTHPANETRIENLEANLPQTRELYLGARARGKRPNCVPPPVPSGN
ncbi:MAG: M48 family metallopeptidase [Myxococcales bacterium]|nr:M48 family metallopeptidase [Myxococcales bacterium]